MLSNAVAGTYRAVRSAMLMRVTFGTMPTDHFYSSDSIDRAAVQRRDEAWVLERLAADDTLFVPVWRDKSFVDRAEAQGDQEWRRSGAAEATEPPERRLKAICFHADEVAPLLDGHRRAILLGQATGVDAAADADAAERLGTTYFALDVSDLDDAASQRPLAGRGEFVGLRRVGPLLDSFDGGLLAYARGMVHWHRQHAFCGPCGSRTLMQEAGFLRRCTDEACGQVHFPRIDPAIIVLITYGERALLGRQAKWDRHWYSVLAGFVEPGESLEQSVRREVKEEAGVRLGAVRYHSSQPWPFPSSLMIGFTADALDDRIRIGDDELDDARWFDRDEVEEALEKGTIRLPPRISISRLLIEGWRSGS